MSDSPAVVYAAEVGEQPYAKAPHPYLGAFRRKETLIGIAILAFFIAFAFLGPLVLRYSADERVGPSFAAPSTQHWLGLDDAGVDMVALLSQGARVSLLVGFSAAVVSVTVGGAVGLIAGYCGKGVDTSLMRITDYLLVIPSVPLMIVVAAIWGASLGHMILVIGLLGWTVTARVIRSQTKSLRARVYVRRAEAQGSSAGRIIVRHVIPNLAPLFVAQAVLGVADAIFAETTLSFLGLGDPNAISWGRTISNAFSNAAISNGAWWAIVPPGIAVALVIIGCSMLGQGLEESLNPRLSTGHLSVRSFSVSAEEGEAP